MNWQPFFVLLGLLVTLSIFEQRADPANRKAVRYFSYFMLLLIGVYVWWYSLFREALFALLAAAILGGLFWLVIGRYNPVSSSDDIRVLGMDD